MLILRTVLSLFPSISYPTRSTRPATVRLHPPSRSPSRPRGRHPLMWVVGETLRLLPEQLQVLRIGLVISASAVRNTSNC
jgi:hypothetical protein